MAARKAVQATRKRGAEGSKAREPETKRPAKKAAPKRQQRAKATPQTRVVNVAAPIPDTPANRPEQIERTPTGQFPPGVSGNPSGRPRTKPITDEMRYALAQLVPGDPQGRTYGQVLAMSAIHRAIKGSYEHLREVTDRVEGKAAQQLQLTGANGGPVEYAHLTPEQRDAEIAKLAGELGFIFQGEVPA